MRTYLRHDFVCKTVVDSVMQVAMYNKGIASFFF